MSPARLESNAAVQLCSSERFKLNLPSCCTAGEAQGLLQKARDEMRAKGGNTGAPHSVAPLTP